LEFSVSLLRPDPFSEAIKRLNQQEKVTVKGLAGSSLSLFIATLAESVPQVLFITSEPNIERYYRELKRLIPDTIFINAKNLFYMPAKIVVTTVDFLDQDLQLKEKMTLATNQRIDTNELLNRLQQSGYTREDIVEEKCEYALRGGILDIFVNENLPVRIELYDDKIYSMRKFNTQTQRSVERIDSFTIKLAIAGSKKPLLTITDPKAIVISEEIISVPLPSVVIAADGEIKYHFTPAYKYFGDLKKLREDIAKKGYKYKFLIPYHSLGENLKSILGEIEIYRLPLEEGFIDEDNNTIYLTESEIFGEIKRRKRAYRGLFIDDLMGLKKDDYVVHSDYGIGQFKQLTLVDFENRKVECLRIDYAGHDKVYLPVEKFNLLERYVATSDKAPKLSKLGSEVWLKIKKRVKKATERMAIDLLHLYTRRSQEKGFKFSQDTTEMNELETSFPYEETEDQFKAINESKNDMESERSAERLVCGDVGYGKTEIALRIAFKAALDGKQTMILCPTTLLSFQHFNTFQKRLDKFPVNVEMVSRFRKRDELKKILKNITTGKIDIAIGTHRLLQPDVQFKNLGLLIIDEEQRFGVAQKEKIRNIIPGIDTFYLSATPIPRTLYMALTGLKNISNIYTPPAGRKDIITNIMFYDEDEFQRIITFEIERGGQVFFVHNRIQTIETIRTKLTKILPNLKICLLHGRMREDISAKRMVDFLLGKYDLLLATAIVESGLDMPRVNTIIVDNAHRFGLADLHQLRGRVGRGDIQAYAYFIVPHHRKITDEANKRLSALVSYTSLGSGFRLALRDMEIRGVGNLLGKEQSGHINSIGYHLYIKVLSETVAELRGKKPIYEPLLDLKIDAYFPDSYIESAYERTALYKRFLNTESKFELDSLRDEITDRFGKHPKEVENLFRLSAIRLKARELGATEVVRKGKQFIYYKEGKIIYKERWEQKA
jgi:transcription-repair coupling factor (superfamily II helicase)